MCDKVDQSKAVRSEMVRNVDGMLYHYQGLEAPCECGKKRYFFSPGSGMGMVEVVSTSEKKQ